jgi:hypothetical protein
VPYEWGENKGKGPRDVVDISWAEVSLLQFDFIFIITNYLFKVLMRTPMMAKTRKSHKGDAWKG